MNSNIVELDNFNDILFRVTKKELKQIESFITKQNKDLKANIENDIIQNKK